jgi:hypothetical protein
MGLTTRGSRACQDWCMLVRSKPPGQLHIHHAEGLPCQRTNHAQDPPNSAETCAKARRSVRVQKPHPHMRKTQDPGAPPPEHRGSLLFPVLHSFAAKAELRSTDLSPRSRPGHRLASACRHRRAPCWHEHCNKHSSNHSPRAREGASSRSPLRRGARSPRVRARPSTGCFVSPLPGVEGCSPQLRSTAIMKVRTQALARRESARVSTRPPP